ncbi:MAG: dihydroorotase [Candidatus Glassbacteria bacterium RIFCSPLOWO2_12_FULL_58_11]|uniref:Dihydroorotase n=1 Tax=Candidatus Glassbacteria bacterium RIFCSPLOWO2_12_FULL_58_11 TaxID=1817867 RepID=A0A1F5Z093_9BACT|nr:MAG: dihydroorotase [Candidatus Glassbacteria bacterium RIFCSPLOWO2_12_FULL_58_11]
MERLLIRGGRLLDPKNKVDGQFDLLIENGKVAQVGRNLPDGGGGARILEAKGKTVVPGLIDMHVHLREPGRPDEETVESGCRAAVAGGFTALGVMPNTDPVTDNQAAIGYIIREAIRAGNSRVYPVGAITKGIKGESLAEMGAMLDAGAVAFTDDGHCVASAEVMRKALTYSLIFGVPMIQHCEDPTLVGDGVMNEGLMSARLGLAGIPAESEEIIVYRDCALARLTGARLHIAHISGRRSVEVVRRFKEEGVKVTAEATPHHFTLTEEEVEGYNTNAKMAPPLRSRADLEALRQGLADGTIDCIASDHAPHHYDEKETAFADAPNGVIGLETSFPVSYTELVLGGVLDLNTLITRMSVTPAAILKLPGGSLGQGDQADVTVLDLDTDWEIDKSKFNSKSRNTPFHGRKVRGRAVATIVGGRQVWKL